MKYVILNGVVFEETRNEYHTDILHRACLSIAPRINVSYEEINRMIDAEEILVDFGFFYPDDGTQTSSYWKEQGYTLQDGKWTTRAAGREHYLKMDSDEHFSRWGYHGYGLKREIA